jgi:DNA-binding transcriptional regulator GbsR (MarR family)
MDTSAERQYVEDFGILMEGYGLPRMAGKILGGLLICDPEHQSLDELTIYLNASKGSISTATRLLIQWAIIERVSFPKDRRDYYRICSDGWERQFMFHLRRATALKEYAQRGLKVISKTSASRKGRLKEMLFFYEWLDSEIPELFKRWQRDKVDYKKEK